MANFTKILVGKDKYPYMLNLDSIESLDLQNRRVYTIGSSDAYSIHDDDSWRSLLHWVDTHKCPDYHC